MVGLLANYLLWHWCDTTEMPWASKGVRHGEVVCRRVAGWWIGLVSFHWKISSFQPMISDIFGSDVDIDKVGGFISTSTEISTCIKSGGIFWWFLLNVHHFNGNIPCIFLSGFFVAIGWLKRVKGSFEGSCFDNSSPFPTSLRIGLQFCLYVVT